MKYSGLRAISQKQKDSCPLQGCCQLLEGDVFIPSEGDGRRYADRKFGYVHACSTWPLSDVKIRIIIQ